MKRAFEQASSSSTFQITCTNVYFETSFPPKELDLEFEEFKATERLNFLGNFHVMRRGFSSVFTMNFLKEEYYEIQGNCR